MLPVLIFLAFLPTTFWFFVFLRKEGYDPLPKRLITRVFFLGALSAFLASILELMFIAPFPSFIKESFLNLDKVKTLDLNIALAVVGLTIVLACIEEVLKIAMVKLFVYNNKNFNQVIDGAVLGISTALGFATLENLVYFAIAFEAGLGSLAFVFVARFLATTLLHATSTGISGYYLGKEKFSGEKGVFLKGLLAAMLLHSTFNLFLLGGILGILFVIVFLIFMFVFLLRRMESTEAQIIWKLVSLRRN